jgi:uncharacterized protein (DUF433 family)
MEWRDRIVSDPEILVGKPVIKGTRISVELILGWLANGWTHEQILESYPTIAREDILAALAFATEHLHKNEASTPRTPEEIEALFRSFNVNTSDYKFDREEANARLIKSLDSGSPDNQPLASSLA